MSDLTTFRDHCRAMGARPTQRNLHLTDEQRALFRALAREIDAYLTEELKAVEPAPDLFGGES